MSSLLYSSVPDSVWDTAVDHLVSDGVATVVLRNDDHSRYGQFETIHHRTFEVTRQMLDLITSNDSCAETANDKQTLSDECDGCTINNENDDDNNPKPISATSSSSSSGFPTTNSDSNTGTKTTHGILLPHRSSLLMIPETADSAHVTGFHSVGSMSQYNSHREGIVFSDGNINPFIVNNIPPASSLSMKNDENKDHDNCEQKGIEEMTNIFQDMSMSLHTIADCILTAIERRLYLPAGWFAQNVGDIQYSSQWHIKRFTTNENILKDDTSHERKEDTDRDTSLDELGQKILLGMHTDPSLISVVIHDQEGINDGAMGLQYCKQTSRRRNSSNKYNQSQRQQHPQEPHWIELPRHGHAVATIFIGSILSYLTGNQWRAVKHRVVDVESKTRKENQPRRMAATLFVRPRGDFRMQVPLPSPVFRKIGETQQLQQEKQHGSRLDDNEEKLQQQNTMTSSIVGRTDDYRGPKTKPPITFDEWLKRVARNYEKHKRKQQQKRQ